MCREIKVTPHEAALARKIVDAARGAIPGGANMSIVELATKVYGAYFVNRKSETEGMPETPNLRWFEEYAHCSCGHRAEGILRGSKNESYSPHCRKCADRRLNASERERERLKELGEPFMEK